MARDGTGTYTRVVTPPVNGDVADADDYNAEQDDIADALTDSINAAGTKAFGANQSMGGFRLTDLATPSSANDAARKAYVDSAITAAAQPLDATLTALAGLSTSASQYIRATGTDAFTMDSYAAVLSNIGALNTTSGDARYAQLASTPTFTAEMVISAAAPALTQRETDASNIRWIRTSSAGVFQEILSNDAFSIFNAYRQVSQSAAVVTLIEELYPHVAPLAAVTGVSGTLTTAHRNRHLELSGGVTMPNSVFTAQDKQTFDPGTSARTFTRGSGVTMYVNGVDSASATLSANQMGGAHWRSASVVVLTGAFS